MYITVLMFRALRFYFCKFFLLYMSFWLVLPHRRSVLKSFSSSVLMQTMMMWRRFLDSLICTWRMVLAWDLVVWNGGSVLTGLVCIPLRILRICCSLPVATLTACGRDVSSSSTSANFIDWFKSPQVDMKTEP